MLVNRDLRNKDLSIIIVNWNTRALLRECLRSVYSNLPPHTVDVIVVDNASTDGSVDMVHTEFPQANLICNSKNLGFARANNQGIALSIARYILLLNSDTVVEPDALERLIDFMDSNPRAAAAGSMLLNPDGSLQSSCYPFPSISRELWRLFHLDKLRAYGVYQMEGWDRNASREVDHIQGASMVLRSEVLAKTGVLDEDFFMYSEELDLCYRLKKDGWKLYWLPQSKVIHYGGKSTKQTAEKMFLELYRSKVLYFRKNHPKKVLAYKITLLLASLIRLLMTPLALLTNWSEKARLFTKAKYYLRLIQKIYSM